MTKITNQKYAILSYGCQMNERDSETISGMLQQMAYIKTQELSEADLIVIHTCCVRESAENKIIGKIGELKHLKKQNPNMIIAVCGCMVQQIDTAKKLVAKAPHIDIVFGTHNLHQLPQLIDQHLALGSRIFEVWDETREVVEGLPAHREGQFKAFVNIAYGCNNFCTYCIVPYVRGRERSRQPQEIIKEINTLVDEGFREITLLGQNVNSYGKDTNTEDISFSKLLKQIDQETDAWRIRFMTSHPKDLNKDIVMAVKECKRICNHFHLPIQSGSSKILQAMNRGYTKERYLDLVKIIRAEIPQASITTDIIVGFPGESEEDFQHTLDVVKQADFDASYTFLYSKRSGTPAATMENQVPDDEKKRRLQQLMKLQSNISLAKNQQLVGQTLGVLVEGPSKTNQELLTGRTSTNKIVVFPGGQELIGQIRQVKISSAKAWNLIGV